MNYLNKNNWKNSLKRGVFAMATAACTLLYACEQKQGNMDADANSSQDTINVDNGAGAGYSTDTSGRASNDTTNTNQGVGPGMMSTPNSDTIGSQPAGVGNRNTGATSTDSDPTGTSDRKEKKQ